MSSVTTKRVGLWLEWPQEGEQVEQIDFAKVENIKTVDVLLNHLGASLTAIENDQGYFKMREKAHRNSMSDFCFFFLKKKSLLGFTNNLANESTNERVLWWSIFEVFLLMCMSAWQVYYLKRFFEIKRSI